MMEMSMIGVNNWCRLRRISRMLLGTTTTRLLGSGTDGGIAALALSEVAVAASKKSEG